MAAVPKRLKFKCPVCGQLNDFVRRTGIGRVKLTELKKRK